jgi:hypothetical protein
VLFFLLGDFTISKNSQFFEFVSFSACLLVCYNTNNIMLSGCDRKGSLEFLLHISTCLSTIIHVGGRKDNSKCLAFSCDDMET